MYEYLLRINLLKNYFCLSFKFYICWDLGLIKRKNVNINLFSKLEIVLRHTFLY